MIFEVPPDQNKQHKKNPPTSLPLPQNTQNNFMLFKNIFMFSKKLACAFNEF